MRDHIATFKRLAQLYAAVRNAYANKVGYEADLAYKTRRLVQENATQDGLGRLTKSVTFDLKTLEVLRGERGSDEGKVFNLVRGLQKEIDDDPNAAPILQPLKDRAERILKDLESRKTTGLAAMEAPARRRCRGKYPAEHLKESVLPLGYKAFLVAVNREACAKYKQALDKLLPPEWTEAVYTESAADTIDRSGGLGRKHRSRV